MTATPTQSRRGFRLFGWARTGITAVAAAKPLRVMPPNEQWRRVVGVIEHAFAQAQSITQQHALVRQQIDTAEYNLDRLLDELRDVMPAIANLRQARSIVEADTFEAGELRLAA
jgi:hypothetical protein